MQLLNSIAAALLSPGAQSLAALPRKFRAELDVGTG